MLTSVTEVAVVFALILLSGLLRMLELSFVSAKKSSLARLADRGNQSAREALLLMADTDRCELTIRIWIALITIFIGAFSCALIANTMFLPTLLGLESGRKTIQMALVFVALGYCYVVLAEIVPGKMAANNPEHIICTLAKPMLTFLRLSEPLIKMMTFSGQFVVITLGLKPVKPPVVVQARITQDDIQALVEECGQVGIFQQSAKEMLHGVLRLDEVRINTVMTPKAELIWLDAQEQPEAIMEKMEKHRHTRYAVGVGNLDELLGVVNARDLFLQWLHTGTIDLRLSVYNPLVVPENQMALQVLERFKQSKVHVAFVMDEYGSLRGMVTMTDIVEAIVGELPKVGAPPTFQAVVHTDGSWLFDAFTPISDFKKHMHLSRLDSDDQGSYNTLSGFIIHHLKHIPDVSEQFDCHGLRFEIVEMDRHRILKVKVSAETAEP